MAKTSLIPVVKKLGENLSGLHYGTVAVILRVHDGRIVDITHERTQTLKELQHPLATAQKPNTSLMTKEKNDEQSN
jgi:hypothetical protein